MTDALVSEELFGEPQNDVTGKRESLVGAGHVHRPTTAGTFCRDRIPEIVVIDMKLCPDGGFVALISFRKLPIILRGVREIVFHALVIVTQPSRASSDLGHSSCGDPRGAGGALHRKGSPDTAVEGGSAAVRVIERLAGRE